ncbi:MAG: phosphoglycerate mutase (2,3-diphosphoglycerate-independent) [Candidatus Harrisonbacteria bacterium RIFCSPLOWO2_02_FULL_41_11]|uniref:2,3-bisphosphoglycerate-independent phosphoglycerate mutase n=1 Tax=Candidatus Harrisonbacteria bacterium RIFCSPHIGHO2_02_FULL_42_16 TaxID=1798404 RepID=A0A1G1ZF88_9BACT|nr:MAG: phosphoglycerate mutase (2,3-diphosphoglycerate-independent) [Candidatus Harrisonbacteria bacterium RIFCSPHIGHO2_02_FULL_42_16]OGY67009.1 MAG: phosphoglycerate mutase (2,3-diphosphoglycerate-independent) [Candidatus Harrisonbacteria bacterium RIFCSPLOWO2_02_FULL_41_11]
MAKSQVVLAILDGWGIGLKNDSNPIFVQGTPNIDYLKGNFLIGALQTSGISIGLPSGIEGNSEGHQTIAAGRIIYQHYPRIMLSIRDGSFAKNRVFLNAFEHVKEYNSALNLAGLLTEGNIHASIRHLIELIKLAKQNGVQKINLHLFTDGKDSASQSALRLFGSLIYEIGGDDSVKIGSIAGRYFAMDREQHWDRVQKVYEAIGGSEAAPSGKLEDIIQAQYQNGSDDFYIEPSVINQDRTVKSNDAILFFNFREDSMRQLVAPFVLDNFAAFPVKKFGNLYVGAMTQYSEEFIEVPAAFPPEKFNNSLGEALADNGKIQIRIGETEKYAHITYYFNGFRQEPFKNEFRVLIPSPSVLSYAENPEMHARELTARAAQAIEDRSFDFILVNYPNGDMVAHTGDFEAAKRAVKAIDEEMGKLTKIALSKGAVLIITSDHGNIESMRNSETGETTTTHDISAVPIYIAGKGLEKKKPPEEIDRAEKEIAGTQADVAPTILEIMGILKPPEMTGESLLKKLK